MRIFSILFLIMVLTFSINHVYADEQNESIVLPFTNHPPIIDGQWTTPEEWTDASQTIMKDMNSGYTAYLLTKSDESSVYFLIDFIDDQSDRESNSNWEDGVMACFDTRNDGGASYLVDDYCFMIYSYWNPLTANELFKGRGNDMTHIDGNSGGYGVLHTLPNFASHIGFSSINSKYESQRDHRIYEFSIPKDFLHDSDEYGFYLLINERSSGIKLIWPGNEKSYPYGCYWGLMIYQTFGRPADLLCPPTPENWGKISIMKSQLIDSQARIEQPPSSLSNVNEIPKPIDAERHSEQDTTHTNPIKLTDFSFIDPYEETSMSRIQEDLKISQKLVTGTFLATFDNPDRVMDAKIDLKLNYFEAGDLNYQEKSEIKTIQLQQRDNQYFTYIAEIQWFPGGIFAFLYTFFASTDTELDTILDTPYTYVSSNEKWYTSAEIIKIYGTDFSGNNFEFAINKKFDTLLGKLKQQNTNNYVYGVVLSPVSFLIEDSQGNKIGASSTTYYSEIQNAMYFGKQNEDQAILVIDPKSSTYNVKIEGIENGEYDLLLYKKNNGAITTEKKEFSQSINKGELKTYSVMGMPKDDGGCLIATASFGTELAPQVQLLREVRDTVLFSTGSGTIFMTEFNEFYYTFSPTIANWERQSPLFKEVVKTTITPMLSTMSLFNYVNIDSEQEMLGYGIGVILLNISMYFVAPMIIIVKLRQKFRKL